MTVTHLRDLPRDASRPAVLFCYGAYGQCLDTSFDVGRRGPRLARRGRPQRAAVRDAEAGASAQAGAARAWVGGGDVSRAGRRGAGRALAPRGEAGAQAQRRARPRCLLRARCGAPPLHASARRPRPRQPSETRAACPCARARSQLRRGGGGARRAGAHGGTRRVGRRAYRGRARQREPRRRRGVCRQGARPARGARTVRVLAGVSAACS